MNKEIIRLKFKKLSNVIYRKPINIKKLIVGDILAYLIPIFILAMPYYALYNDFYVNRGISSNPFTTNILTPFGIIEPFLWMILFIRIFRPYFHSLFKRNVPKKSIVILLIPLFFTTGFTNAQHHHYAEFSDSVREKYGKTMINLAQTNEILFQKLNTAEEKILTLDNEYKPETISDNGFAEIVENSDLQKKLNDIKN